MDNDTIEITIENETIIVTQGKKQLEKITL